MRWGLLFVALLAMPAAAQSCPGDCNGDGEVRVDEMIAGVRIALGEAAVATCPAFDANTDGTLSIDELVRAVTNLLNGCPAVTPATPTDTPSPSPPATETGTPTASATATATPTIPPVGGAWVEAPLAVVDSTCTEDLTAAFAERLGGRGPCAQQVELLDDATVRVTDCSSQTVDGPLDRDGTMHLVFPPSEGGEPPCTLTLNVNSVVPAGADPVVANYTFALAFGGEGCPFEDCTIRANAAWTRPE